MKSRKLTVTLFIIYLLVLVWIVLLKTQFSFSSIEIRRSISLIPFSDLLNQSGRLRYNEVIYNCLAFVPFGVFLCMLKKKRTFASLVVPIAASSLLFEVAQYVFAIGVSDITDLIANTTGGMIGVGVFFIAHRVCKENTNKVLNIAALALAVALALFIAVVRILFLRSIH